MKGFVIPASWQ